MVKPTFFSIVFSTLAFLGSCCLTSIFLTDASAAAGTMPGVHLAIVAKVDEPEIPISKFFEVGLDLGWYVIAEALEDSSSHQTLQKVENNKILDGIDIPRVSDLSEVERRYPALAVMVYFSDPGSEVFRKVENKYGKTARRWMALGAKIHATTLAYAPHRSRTNQKLANELRTLAEELKIREDLWGNLVRKIESGESQDDVVDSAVRLRGQLRALLLEQ